MIRLSGSKGKESGDSPQTPGAGIGLWLDVRSLWEVLLCILVCVCFAAVPVPDINESHYLTKARHFWNGDTCPQDIFLQSTDAQWVYFFATGWVAKFVSIGTFAWIGRAVSWVLLSASVVFVARQVRVSGIRIPVVLAMMLVLVRTGNLAGEWIVGGFEAKTIAWPLILFATGFAMRGRWSLVWCLCGAAAAFHFVLGWWAIVCLAICRLYLWSREKSFRPPGTLWSVVSTWIAELILGGPPGSATFRSLLSVLTITMAGLIGGALPMLLDGSGVSNSDSVVAARIQVFQRLPHHLYFGDFAASRVASFGILMMVWSFLYCRMTLVAPLRMIGTLALVTTGLNVCGLVLSGIAEGSGNSAELATSLLRLYWFRMADVMVPLSVALMCGHLLESWRVRTGRVHARISLAVTGLLLVATGLEGVGKISAVIPPADAVGIAGSEPDAKRAEETVRNWQRVCEWCRNNTPGDALFLTPFGQQTFNWYSNRAEWFCWKHAPQDAAGLIEWNRRRELVLALQNRFGPEIVGWPAGVLTWLLEQEHLDFVIVPQRELDRWGVLKGMTLVYPASSSLKTTWCVLKSLPAGSSDD